MTEQRTSSTQGATGPAGLAVSSAAVGPLTIRDLAVLGSVAIIFIASLVPIIETIAGNFNLWNTGGLFYIGIGVVLPLIVGGLFLARRLSPDAKVRIGSLSVDQFASVVASFATAFFFFGTVTNFGVAYLIGLIGSLLLLAATVCAQWIPVLASDFVGRTEVPAHLAARDALPVRKSPAAPKPVVATPTGGLAFGQSAGTGHGAQTQSTTAESAGGLSAGGQGTQASQLAGARGGAEETASHTSAGQIFTPAKESTPVAHTAAQVSSVAAKDTGSGAVTGAATGAVGGEAAGSAAPVSQGTKETPVSRTSQPDTKASSEATSHGAGVKPALTQENRSKEASAASPAAEAAGSNAQNDRGTQSAQGGFNLPKDTGATTLNPQVAEPAKVTSASESAAAKPAKESIAATVNPKASAAVIAEPFWFAVDRPQNVIDPNTRQFAFKLAPGAWILALEDRGTSFLVQDSHGKTGVLLDLVGIERASDSQ